MKLEISLLGDYYSIGLLHLDRYLIKAGMRAYGKKEWADVLTGLANNADAGGLKLEVQQKIKREVRRVYSNSGVLLGGRHFALEAFVDGASVPLEKVEEDSHRISLAKVTGELRKKEILGVCRTTGIGSVTFRWNNVDEFDEDMILLEIHEMSQVLNEPNKFNLIFNITYEGRPADSQRREESDALTPLGHIFHMMG